MFPYKMETVSPMQEDTVMTITADLNLVKKINKSLVLDRILRRSPVSRAHIAKETGLTKATVSALVGELIDEHLVYETGTGASSGGRKPVMLVFNRLAGYAVGVDLGVNYMLAVLTDLQGTVVDELRRPLRSTSFEDATRELSAAIRTLTERAPESSYGIVGIGIGVPGITDDQGTVLFAPHLGWENAPLKERLETEFGIPVAIDNEANAGAIGEKNFGAGRQSSNLVYVSVGMGIGTGIIIQNELYRGNSGFSGEMGHVSIQAEGKPCRCGNIGCWELYASENALIEMSRELPSVRTAGAAGPDLEELLALAQSGNADVAELFRRVGTYLGVGITNIINIFNPELIIIGNRFTAAEPWLSGPVRSVIDRRSLPFHRRDLRLEFSSLGTRSTVLGAAFLAISQFFAASRISVR